MEISREKFGEILYSLAEKNHKLKDLLYTNGGYDRLNNKAKTVIDNYLGVIRQSDASWGKK